MVATEVRVETQTVVFDRIPGPEPIVHYIKSVLHQTQTIQMHRAICVPQDSKFNHSASLCARVLDRILYIYIVIDMSILHIIYVMLVVIL